MLDLGPGTPPTNQPVCSPCPSHTVGNGLFCLPCPGFKTPYFDSVSCVCQHNTGHTENDTCSCPAGHEFAESLCQPCPPDTYNPVDLELLDNWYDQYATCSPCSPGYTAPPGSTACTACLPGQYRETNQDGCQNCTQGYYAFNASDEASCVPCNTTCGTGYSQAECPLNPGLWVCHECPPAPTNSSYYANCLYTCDPGLYVFNDTCVPCTTAPCQPGWNRTGCTHFHDSDCLTECQDDTKPLLYSNWTLGCQWACVQGYSLVTKDYGLFAIDECVAVGPSSFWSKLFS